MTPFAEKLWHQPMDRGQRSLIGRYLTAAQFFDCTKLEPIVAVRSKTAGAQWAIQEMIAGEIPADVTWLEAYGDRAMIISDKAENLDPGERFACLLARQLPNSLLLCEFRIFTTGRMRFVDQKLSGIEQVRKEVAQSINFTWFSIEAMQTPGGLCHGVTHSPSRQTTRAAKRAGNPVHKWVEIRLGRDRAKSGGGKGGTGRTVAWHYRRGHKVNHPNPNYPKWRKGSWVGSPEHGIRTHLYTVEVPA